MAEDAKNEVQQEDPAEGNGNGEVYAQPKVGAAPAGYQVTTVCPPQSHCGTTGAPGGGRPANVRFQAIVSRVLGQPIGDDIGRVFEIAGRRFERRDVGGRVQYELRPQGAQLEIDSVPSTGAHALLNRHADYLLADVRGLVKNLRPRGTDADTVRIDELKDIVIEVATDLRAEFAAECPDPEVVRNQFELIVESGIDLLDALGYYITGECDVIDLDHEAQLTDAAQAIQGIAMMGGLWLIYSVFSGRTPREWRIEERATLLPLRLGTQFRGLKRRFTAMANAVDRVHWALECVGVSRADQAVTGAVDDDHCELRLGDTLERAAQFARVLGPARLDDGSRLAVRTLIPKLAALGPDLEYWEEWSRELGQPVTGAFGALVRQSGRTMVLLRQVGCLPEAPEHDEDGGEKGYEEVGDDVTEPRRQRTSDFWIFGYPIRRSEPGGAEEGGASGLGGLFYEVFGFRPPTRREAAVGMDDEDDGEDSAKQQSKKKK